MKQYKTIKQKISELVVKNKFLPIEILNFDGNDYSPFHRCYLNQVESVKFLSFFDKNFKIQINCKDNTSYNSEIYYEELFWLDSIFDSFNGHKNLIKPGSLVCTVLYKTLLTDRFTNLIGILEEDISGIRIDEGKTMIVLEKLVIEDVVLLKVLYENKHYWTYQPVYEVSFFERFEQNNHVI